MKLELKAKHFEGTAFYSNECGIERAYTDKTGNQCGEYVDKLQDISTGKYFNHRPYELNDFNFDKRAAQSHNWDETVIRTIELTEV